MARRCIDQRNDGAGLYGAFRGGLDSAVPYADFDQSYDPINGLSYEEACARYTVASGDSFESIALSVWGDASYWYLIADVNGMSSSNDLVAGMSIIIPNKVHNSHNNADTYRVYDPNEAIGDLFPSAAKPPKKAKCGVFGQIMLVAIAVAVTIIALPSTAGTSVIFGQGLIAGALGSAASQAVGLATGLQSKFDLKGFALSALAGGITAGIGPKGNMLGLNTGTDGLFGGGWLASAGRGIVSSIATQGIGVATGLQGKFNWAGVATAGIGAGIGSVIGRSFADAASRWASRGQQFVSGMAGGIAAAAGESLIAGNSFGDTLMSSLPSIIGNTVGNLAADAVAGNGDPKRSGKFAQASTGSRTEGPSPEEQYFADIVVTARDLKDEALKQGRSIGDRIDRFFGTNIFGGIPMSSYVGFDSPAAGYTAPITKGELLGDALIVAPALRGAGSLLTVGGRTAATVDTGIIITENLGTASAANGARLGPQLLAEEVANGHALAKHLAGGEFAPLGIRTKAQFQNFVEKIVSNPATPTRCASDGTKYYLDETTRTIVISGSRGEVTAFRPDYGVGWENYLNSQVPRNARLPGYDPVPNGR
ncbi:LysM domain-containing protein [Sphingobium sp. HBC34]|uniref:LysM domain-containing protein n=1 Tax=Sphingobium cyanobacteriorum TaxID=3063954 RepID=A0ABT8ZQ19_9SPHN|nr:LysM domain-containing protein [Sphingobium sp. HBC34]MDO7836615.1 LysM domain-containing protein [Sphingobium sp. HBC34]